MASWLFFVGNARQEDKKHNSSSAVVPGKDYVGMRLNADTAVSYAQSLVKKYPADNVAVFLGDTGDVYPAEEFIGFYNT